MKRVLLTGFEPFGAIAGNASWEAVEAAAERAVPGASIEAVRLPVSFSDAPAALEEAVGRAAPDLVVAVGQAAGRKAVTVERVAVNVGSAPIPDNDGHRPIGEPLIAEGPDAYFTGLPLAACVAAAREAGVPAAESLTAGSYVCNAVFYRLMHLAAARDGLLGGFVHVPLAPGQSLDGRHPTIPAELVAEGLVAIARASLGGGGRSEAAVGAVH